MSSANSEASDQDVNFKSTFAGLYDNVVSGFTNDSTIKMKSPSPIQMRQSSAVEENKEEDVTPEEGCTKRKIPKTLSV